MTSLLAAGTAANSRPHFAPPPWTDDDPRRQELGVRLPANHLARRIDQAVARLDLSMIFAAYSGTGSPAHAPAPAILRSACAANGNWEKRAARNGERQPRRCCGMLS